MRGILIPQGTFRISDSLLINSVGLHISVPPIRGIGYGYSILKVSTAKSALVYRKGGQQAVYQIVVEDITIQGNGSSTSTGSGVFADTSSLGQIQRCRIEDFKYAIRLWQSNSMVVESNYITECKFGIWLEKQCNETSFINSYPVFSDSIQFYQNAGNRINIIGGSISGQATSAGDYGVWLTGAGKLNMWGVSFEGTDSAVFKIDGSSTINIDECNVAYNASTSHRFMEISGGATARIVGKTVHSSVPAGTASIIQSGSTTRVYADNTTHLRTLWDGTRTYYPNEFEAIPGSGSISADSTNRGKFHMKIKQAAINDDFLLTSLRDDNNYNTISIIGGGDIMVATDAANQPTYTSDVAIRTGRDVFSVVSGTDSTIVTVVADTNGWAELYGVTAMVNHDNTNNTGTTYNWNVFLADDNGAAGTGTLKFVVFHTGYAASDNHRLNWLIYIKPTGWVK